MKKVIAWLLTLCMIFQLSGMTVSAAKEEEPKAEVLNNKAPQTGALEVEMVFSLPLGEADAADLKLSAALNRNGSKETVQFKSEETNSPAKKARAVFEGLEPGEYELTVTGSMFESYSQTVEVKAMKQKVKLVNTYRDKTIITADVHPGVMGVGDIDGSGKIDSRDKDKLIEAVNSGSGSTKGDLNGDGRTDLTDLQYFTYNYQNEKVNSSVLRTYTTEAMVPQVTAGSLAKGKIENVLTGGGTVSVKPAGSGDISGTNPVELSIDLLNRPDVNAAGITIVPPRDSENKITDGTITVEYEDENNQIQEKRFTISPKAKMYRSAAYAAAQVITEADGTIVIDLGGQVAVKKVTIKVTATGSGKLADIAEVEFLNGMEDRIPAPQMNIPANVSAKAQNKKFTVTWDAQPNVTGYEVKITHDGVSKVLAAAGNTMLVSSFGDEKIKNKELYEVNVRSINGEWDSGYSDTVKVTPMPDKAPDPPENVNVTGGYRQLKISWKKMEDTDHYTLYYRAKGESAFKNTANISENSYQLIDLKDNTTYEIYLTGTNDIGTGKKSQTYVGTTVDLKPAITSNYKLINTEQGVGRPGAHIENVEYPGTKAESVFAVADHDYSTSWAANSWDTGGFNDFNVSPVVVFDQEYEMDRFIVIPDEFQQFNYSYAKTCYWGGDGSASKKIEGSFTRKTSTNNKTYYEFNFAEPVKVKKIQVSFALATANKNGRISIGEMKFYYYDSLEKEVSELYTDEMHVSLADGVTKEMIDTLETRANTPDSVSGEYHPKRDMILRDIDNAKKLLNDEKIKEPMLIDTTVTKSKDGALGFAGGLNAWQPLGVAAHEGEELSVYVGREKAAIGANARLRLIATQYHAESGKWNAEVLKELKVGRNDVTIPKISSMDVEHGGSLYVEFTENNDKAKIAVRVSGGQDIPKLDISQAKTEAEKKEAVRTYVEELNAYVPKLPELHNSLHKGNADTRCDYDYDSKNCILGATDIVLDKMMYSVSAEQILAGINSKFSGNPTVDQQTEVLYESLEAMDQMVSLFYQHKGLADAGGAKNKLPSSRLNIRYMRMFAGAFMYAGGLHIGIEWGSVPGLAKAVPVESDKGKYKSGNLFGWGIAHEIGHIINQPQYAIAEITNNYFSVLAQAKETNDSVRFKYPDVYEKVTSGTKGRAGNVFTSLAMYWQLHLAYDDGYNYKTYDNYDEQFGKLFFARADTYARNTSQAPKPDGIALTLPKDVDNTLMRLSCAAAEKNLLDFFERWGMTPDEGTIAYADQFEKESRNICYITDEARAYRLEGGESTAGSVKVTASLNHVKNSNQVTLKLSNDAANKASMLGYEIFRNGKTVGFVSAGEGETEFTDTIATINNRVFTYEVVGYDKLLQKTDKITLDSIKISHDGSVDKSDWTVTTNMTSADDKAEKGSDDIPEPSTISAIDKIYNNDYTDRYTGNANAPEIIMDFHKTITAAGIKVTAGDQTKSIKNYEVYVSGNKTNWTLAGKGRFTYENDTATAYFNKEGDSWMYTYDAAYMKLVVKNQKDVSIDEIDVLGPSGDNVEFERIGVLKEDYVYDKKGSLIPKGSVIFTGEYKGNPAYSVVKLLDQDGNIIGGSQLIFANVPEKGELGEISSGTWVYYIEPNDISEIEGLTAVKAELYRVNNAVTNQGERLVSDTLTVEMPENLPEISLEGGAVNE